MSILINRIIRDSYLVRAAKKAQALMGAFYVIDQIFGKFFC